MLRSPLMLVLTAVLAAESSSAVVEFPGVTAGKAQARCAETPDAGTPAKHAELGNKLFSAAFDIDAKGAVVFGGMKAADGTELLKGGTGLFTIKLANGRVFSERNMNLKNFSVTELKGKKGALPFSESLNGQAVQGVFSAPDKSFSVKWRAVLRNGSHYLRQEFTITAHKDTEFDTITPMTYRVAGETPQLSGNTTRGHVVLNDKLFMGMETPMSIMTIGNKGADEEGWNPEEWTPDSFVDIFNVPNSVSAKYGKDYADMKGPVVKNLKAAEGPVAFAESGECELMFNFQEGRGAMNLAGVQLVDDQGTVLSEDIHYSRIAGNPKDNVYTLTVPAAKQTYTLRYLADVRKAPVNIGGGVVYSLPLHREEKTAEGEAADTVRGAWSRKTTLAKGQKWEVSSVVGLLAPQQTRRSFLAYSERERAVPYRPFVHYNDWYEVGIVRHDNKDPLKRTTEKISLDIINKWNREMFQKRRMRVDAFVIDDGWDDFNTLWDFHAGFPNGFTKLAAAAKQQKAGMGTWLGPVGGYGSSKKQRLSYWNDTHPGREISNFQLSGQEYFDAFTGRCKQMVKDYGMRYFKFDGISTSFHAKGPANEEDAEGIICVLSSLRAAKPNLFINTKVGSWASPFWFHYSDCLWRQENDFGQMGNMGDPRDKWMTYRDRLVHEVFVEGAPLCPINTIMTHGTIITKNGPPKVMSKDPANCVKEMRAAFGSGSGLQEIYADGDLLDQENGRLWDELAACINWVRRNQEVLADVHWVGGNPWNGADGDVYGWAAWSKQKSTLTLRNSSDKPKTLRTTLRQILDVPPTVQGGITFKNSFDDQRKLPDFTNKELSYDTEIELTLEPMEVLVLEGTAAQ